MKALGRKIIIKPEEKKEQTETGIYIPEKQGAQNSRGVVVSVGGDVKDITEGITVLYAPLMFDEIELDGVQYHVIDDSDVFAIL